MGINWNKCGDDMKESNSKPLQEMRVLSRSVESGLVDNQLLRSFVRTLETSPEDLLPHAIAEVYWTAFLLYKADLKESAKRVAFTVLAWLLRNSDDANLIQSGTRNVQYLFKKEGRQISPEEVQRIATEGKFGHAESNASIEP
jgi:hypothetical protein